MTLRRHYQPCWTPASTIFCAAIIPVASPSRSTAAAWKNSTGPRRARRPWKFASCANAKPSASGYLIRADQPLPEDRQGLAISTYGKVIRRGWDWIGLTPACGGLRRRYHRSAGARRLLDPQQGRLHPRRRPRRDLFGISQSDPRSGRQTARPVGRWPQRRRSSAATRSAAATARSRASIGRSRAGFSHARLPGRAKSRRTKALTAGYSRHRQ